MASYLKTLNQQEDKYVTELNTALEQYAALQYQVANMGFLELDIVRQAIRPDKEA